MKTPNLITIPQSGVSKRTKLRILKKAFGIETWRTPGFELPWCAVHLSSARRIGKPYGVKPDANIGDCMAAVCRLMDDAGVITYGTTERDAIRQLCHNVGIPLQL